MEDSQLDYVLEGEGTVVSQEPLAGQVLPKGSKIVIRFEADVNDDQTDKNSTDSNGDHSKTTKEKTKKTRKARNDKKE